jgi:uncharacterized membrane protein
LRIFTTITDEERATVTAQIQRLAWPILGLALVVYVGLIVGFSYASPQFIVSVQPYLLNPPDFSKCEPAFSARITAHILFAHLALIFCGFLALVSLASRYENGQLNRVFSKYYVMLLAMTLIAAIPVLSQDFLRRSHIFHRSYHFADFCAQSWDRPVFAYFIVLGVSLLTILVAIAFAIMEFVWSGNKQWIDSFDTDPETRAEQLVTRLEYGAITQEEFDEAAKQFHLK